MFKTDLYGSAHAFGIALDTKSVYLQTTWLLAQAGSAVTDYLYLQNEEGKTNEAKGIHATPLAVQRLLKENKVIILKRCWEIIANELSFQTIIGVIIQVKMSILMVSFL